MPLAPHLPNVGPEDAATIARAVTLELYDQVEAECHRLYKMGETQRWLDLRSVASAIFAEYVRQADF